MKKTIDCVRMKNEIQRRLQAEYRGVTLEERSKRIDEKLLSNPILGSLYRRLLDKRNGDAVWTVAEEPVKYKIK